MRRLTKCNGILINAETGEEVERVETGDFVTFIHPGIRHMPTCDAYHQRRADRGYTGGIRPMVERAEIWHRRVCQCAAFFALGALLAAGVLLTFCAIYHSKG